MNFCTFSAYLWALRVTFPLGKGTGEVAVQVSCCLLPSWVSKGSCYVTLLQGVTLNASERSLQWSKGMRWEIWLLGRISRINSVALSKLWLPNLLSSLGGACNNFETPRQAVPYIKRCFIFLLISFLCGRDSVLLLKGVVLFIVLGHPFLYSKTFSFL